jgi:hypothetical protein
MGLFDSAFLPGSSPARDGPLARFLPPLEEGIAADWLPPHASPPAWILDPFGAAPHLAVEAARRGYRVLVTANNPITRFLLEMAALAPSESELKAALADLAITKKGNERLEDHLKSLYQTTCAKCETEIPARAFLWRKGENAPFARLYECPHCGDAGERPVNLSDIDRVREVANSAALHRARLIERVAPPDDPDREYAEEALSVYGPRAIYVLATLINRLDSPGVTPERRRLLSALFLSVCDSANSLWSRGNERPRPKQLTVSNEFRENNLWLAIESAITEWAGNGDPVPVTTWPAKIPDTGGIILFEGRIAELASVVKEAPIAAVFTSLPRPNQAFWTLCALWSGWLWGADSAEPFHLVLRRRRYDWAWHTEALQAAMRSLYELLALNVPFFAFLPEPEPGFLTAALVAAETGGFALNSLALRTQYDAAQLTWRRVERLHHSTQAPNLDTLREDLRAHLSARGEPAAYLPLFTVGLASLLESHSLLRPSQTPDEILRNATSAIQEALLDEASFPRYLHSQGAETGLWGLPRGIEMVEPLSDRVEMAVVNFLKSHPGCTLLDIQRDLAPRFPGLLTPSRGLLLPILASYADHEAGRYTLRAEDAPAARTADIAHLSDLLVTLGERLDYTINRLDARTLVWEEGEASLYVFHLKASAVIGGKILEGPYPLGRSLIVLPGGRAGLLAYKRQRDPALAARQEGLRFVKFRLVRALADLPDLTRETFESRLLSDPIEPARGQRPSL